MRFWLGLALLATPLLAVHLLAQEPLAYLIRYNIEQNPINYSQKTPQDAMKSIAKAIDGGRFDYLLAQLSDPLYVDPRVVEYRGLLFPREELQSEAEAIAREPDAKARKIKILEKEKKDKARMIVAFNRMVVETRKHLDEDPVLLKELRLFAKDAEWEIDEDKATATMKKLTPRKVYFRKRENRWFMEERNQ